MSLLGFWFPDLIRLIDRLPLGSGLQADLLSMSLDELFDLYCSLRKRQSARERQAQYDRERYADEAAKEVA